jgi:hypothetical protein
MSSKHYIVHPYIMSAIAPCRSRFSRPLFLWALASLITEFALRYSAGATPLDHRLPILMWLPFIPRALFLVALVRTLRKMDELQERITLESIAIAFVLTLCLISVIGGLQSAGINSTSLQDEIGNFILLFWASAYVFSVRRYR